MFKEVKNRDAWSTIRGFVYQVDSTILRWLNLQDNEVLELEKGEDIDIVLNDIKAKELSRQLEQVKYRESNLSLNQNNVIELFYNFFIHKQNNKSNKLLYRFFTNTSYNIERPALFPDGISGIEAWIKLSNTPKISFDNHYYILIKKHLIGKIGNKITSLKKNKDEQKKWINFKTKINDDNYLTGFIKDFEWSFDNDDNNQIGKRVKDELITNGFVEDNTQAEKVYHNLFFSVFKLLSNKGLKQLGKEDLTHEIYCSVSEGDKEIYGLLSSLVDEVNSRVDEIEFSVESNTNAITEITDRIDNIDQFNSIFDYKLKTHSNTPPAIIVSGSKRIKKVAEIITLFNDQTWVHFEGINGTGKTQLAALIVSHFENYYWLELREFENDIDKASLMIESFLSKISNCPIKNNKVEWFFDVKENIEDNTIIILNDLPNIIENSNLSQLLIQFLNNLSDSSIKVLTTSNYKLHSSITQSIKSGIFIKYVDFEFSDKEIEEYLINSGANKETIDNKKLIAAVTNRNPRLVSAIIQYLSNRNWGDNSEDIINQILTKEFTSEVIENVQQLISKQITDSNSKELLYRLSLIHWDFDFSDVKAVASIEEKINYIREIFQTLVDVWIQKQHDNTYLISPLIQDIGKDNLDENIIFNVHSKFAENILTKNKSINPIDGMRVINSFIKATDFINAGVILLKIYQSAKTEKEVKVLKDWGFLHYWIGNDLPVEMKIILKGMLRYEQLRLYNILKMETSPVYKHLNNYIADDSLRLSEKIQLNYIYVAAFKGENFDSFWKSFEFLSTNYNHTENELKKTFSLKIFSSVLWIVAQYLTEEEDINKWLEFISFHYPENEKIFFKKDVSQATIMIISNNIITSQNHLEKEEINWEETKRQLMSFSSFFNNIGLEVLEAVILKEVVSLEFNNNVDKEIAISSAKKYIEKFQLTDAKYLFFEVLGKSFYNVKDKPSSMYWIDKAITTNCTQQIGFVDTLIYGAASYANQSVELCKRAEKLAKIRKYNPEIDYLQILGELAIAHWVNGDYENSYKTFEDLIDRLFELRKSSFDKKWIRIFKWVGHSLGYISADVRKKPSPTLEDGEEYIEPYVGILSFNTKDLSGFYNQKDEPYILVHMAWFAEGVNKISKSYKWAEKALDLARKYRDQGVIRSVSMSCNQFFILNYKVDEAIEFSLLLTALSNHVKGNTKERYDRMGKIDLNKMYGNKPSEEWNNAEAATIGFTIIPLFIKLLLFHVAEDNLKDERTNDLLNPIKNYITNASDKKTWEFLYHIIPLIIKQEISESYLAQLANNYGEVDKKHIQIICIIGSIYLTNDYRTILTQILNVFPYLSKLYKQTESITNHILNPFIKNRIIHALEEEYVGSKKELDEIIANITGIKNNTINALQLIIQPVVEELEFNIPMDKKAWLFDFNDL